MPQLGESIVEATVARWLVKPGSTVERGQPIAEVETDKATNEIPAPAAGVIGEILVPEGQTVKVGTEILRYTEGAAAAPTAAAAPVAVPAAVKAEEKAPSRHLAPRPAGRFASPAVRRIARERGLDLDTVAGTGRNGRITPDDVRKGPEAPAARAPRALQAPVYTPVPGDTVVPFSRRRKLISEHLSTSLVTAAHVAAVVEIDMSRVVRARDAAKGTSEVKLTFTAYVVRALAQALGEHPAINASVVGDTHVLRKARNIGVAVDTKDGLMVPVLKRTDELSLSGIARALEEMSAKARSGALTAEDLSGGSFTLSNPGRDGNLFGVSIIRQPEVAILRTGEIQKRAVVRELDGEDAIVIRPIMFAALSYDHRVIDGATGNAFLHRVRALLESV